MLTEAIKNFPKQFAFEPVIENAEELSAATTFIVAGMGGSALAADLLKTGIPSLDVVIHRNYGLPEFPYNTFKKPLIIASSYSGNTEEALDAFNCALSKQLPAAAISVGGELLKIARACGAPFIQFPDTGIQPRSALGFSLVSLLKLMGQEKALLEVRELTHRLNVADAEAKGKKLAENVRGVVPIIYSSSRNGPIAYNWKIRFNETGKIPAFHNVFPELNHNEIIGFDVKEKTKKLSQNFYFIFLKDADDHPRIIRRMEVLKDLYLQRDLPVEIFELNGGNVWEKIFSSLLAADWAAYYTAMHYEVQAEEVDFVEEFKKLISQ